MLEKDLRKRILEQVNYDVHMADVLVEQIKRSLRDEEENLSIIIDCKIIRNDYQDPECKDDKDNCKVIHFNLLTHDKDGNDCQCRVETCIPYPRAYHLTIIGDVYSNDEEDLLDIIKRVGLDKFTVIKKEITK